jgi:hypothetical protein
MSPVDTIVHRVYADFLMPSRLGQYQGLLQLALDRGYTITSVDQIWQMMGREHPFDTGRYLVLRHDVDTDPGTAGNMLEIERDLGVSGSYYFRLSTIDPTLMTAVQAAGGEASYHYEELATVSKRRRPRDRAAALRLIPEALDLFAANLERIRSQTGITARTVASHGDFVNRSVGVANWAILTDRGRRAQLGIDLETYDAGYLERFTGRYSDTQYPKYWVGDGPQAALDRGDPLVQILVHPRHWNVARRTNAIDDVTRAIEGLSYRLPGGPARWRD